MKLLFISCYFYFASVQITTAQKLDTATSLSIQTSYDMYMQKHKINNTTGWVLLGSGIAMMGIGTYVYLTEAIGEGDVTSTGSTLFYLGTASTIVSIPFFVAAGKYKREAGLALKKETVYMGNKILPKSNYTALTLKIQL